MGLIKNLKSCVLSLVIKLTWPRNLSDSGWVYWTTKPFRFWTQKFPLYEWFSCIFYGFAWYIIGLDMVKLYQFCRSKGYIQKGLNSNLLCLFLRFKVLKRLIKVDQLATNFSFKCFIDIITWSYKRLVKQSCLSSAMNFFKNKMYSWANDFAEKMVNELRTKMSNMIGSFLHYYDGNMVR